MKTQMFLRTTFALGASFLLASVASAQIGRRFPSEKKIVPDPVTGIPLTFLTSTPAGDSKIYQTHPQWTSDGKWLIFRSNRVPGQAMAVNEESGVIVQVTDGGFTGMLCVARLSMKLYVMRDPKGNTGPGAGGPPAGGAPAGGPQGQGGPGGTQPPAGGSGPAPAMTAGAPAPGGQGAPAGGQPPQGGPGAAGAPAGGAAAANAPRGPMPSREMQIVEVDLAKLFADSEAGKLQGGSAYERLCATIPADMGAGGDMALDANEEVAYIRLESQNLASKLPAGTKVASGFGPRGMGAGPAGLASVNLKTGEIKFIVAVPFKIGHVQSNPWVPGEIVFCWETGGKAPQRTWVVNADGTGLRALYPEAEYDWITHEAVITKDEVAIAILAHRQPGVGVDKPDDWGPSGSGAHPTGLGIVNLRTREMRIVSQVPMGNVGKSYWHVNGSGDGRWAVADDFQLRLWLVDRRNGETVMLADCGHKGMTAKDHLHPTFNADGTKIEIQCGMLSEDGKSLNICVVPVPKSFLARTYSEKIAE